MANAIQEMRDDAIAIGEARGEARGIAIGEERGVVKGLTWLANFVESGVLTLEQAARQTGMTEDEFIAKTGLKI